LTNIILGDISEYPPKFKKKRIAMKARLFHPILITIFFLQISCTKNEPIPIDPCINTPCDSTQLSPKLDTLWTIGKKESNDGSSTFEMIFNEGSLYLNSQTNNLTVISAYSASNGEIRWIRDFNVPVFGSFFVYKDYVIAQSRTSQIFKLNKHTGQTVSIYTEYDGYSSHSYGQIIGDYYYYTKRSNDDSIATLLRSRIEDMENWEVVYELKRGSETGGSRPQIQSYNLWINPANGDSILVLQHRMALPNRVDLVGWNMSQKRIDWRHDNLTSDGNSNHNQILVLSDKIYFGGSTAFYCFHPENGELIWKYSHPNDSGSFMFLQPGIAESENSLIIKSNSTYLFSLDKDSGIPNWVTESTGNFTLGASSPQYYDGIVYLKNRDELFAIKANNGEILYRERSSGVPLGPTSFRGEIAIDEAKGIFYATSSDKVFAIRVYKE